MSDGVYETDGHWNTVSTLPAAGPVTSDVAAGKAIETFSGGKLLRGLTGLYHEEFGYPAAVDSRSKRGSR